MYKTDFVENNVSNCSIGELIYLFFHAQRKFRHIICSQDDEFPIIQLWLKIYNK